jgi:Tol biopolymer transport system component
MGVLGHHDVKEPAMRRSHALVPRLATTALSLAAVVACSGPAAPTRTTLPLNTAATTPVSTSGPSTGADAAIDVTALTGRIVFDDSQDVWSINADGTGLVRLTESPWREFQPALSPDGRLVAYRSEPSDYPELWVMNADGSGQHQLTSEGGFPAWSPDGSKIAYAPPGGPSGRSSIAIMYPDGSGQRRLPDTDFGENPSWSPDGKRIVYTSAHTGERLMYVVDVEGSQVVGLSSAGEGSMVAWSPDGGSILFASHRDHPDNYRDIYAMRPDGSGVRRLTFDSAEAPAWSRDGRYIVFSAPGGLGVMRADGSGVTSLPVHGVAWASFPDWQ